MMVMTLIIVDVFDVDINYLQNLTIRSESEGGVGFPLILKIDSLLSKQLVSQKSTSQFQTKRWHD